MLQKGQYLIYSFYGVCLIDDIQENEILGKKLTFYAFHPLYDKSLKIMVPESSPMILSRSVINREEAEKILSSVPNVEPLWFDEMDTRKNAYHKVLKNCDLGEMIRVIKALVIKEKDTRNHKKYLSINDSKALDSTKMIFAYEIGLALEIAPERVIKEVEKMIL